MPSTHLGIRKRKQQQSRTVIHRILNIAIPITCLSWRKSINCHFNPRQCRDVPQSQSVQHFFFEKRCVLVWQKPVVIHFSEKLNTLRSFHNTNCDVLEVRSLAGMKSKGEHGELSWFYSQYQSGGRHRRSMWRLSSRSALHLQVTPFQPFGLAPVREAIPFSPFADLIEPLAMCLCKTQYFINFYTNAIFKNSRQSRGWAGSSVPQHTADVLSSTSDLIV